MMVNLWMSTVDLKKKNTPEKRKKQQIKEN